MRVTVEQRFWPQVDKSGEHWLWTGRSDKDGYPVIHAMGETRGARVAYRLQVGPIPAGFVVDHTCFIRLCVRGIHLRAVTRPVNASITRRTIARSECDGQHSIWACLPCRAAYQRQRHATDKAWRDRQNRFSSDWKRRNRTKAIEGATI